MAAIAFRPKSEAGPRKKLSLDLPQRKQWMSLAAAFTAIYARHPTTKTSGTGEAPDVEDDYFYED